MRSGTDAAGGAFAPSPWVALTAAGGQERGSANAAYLVTFDQLVNQARGLRFLDEAFEERRACFVLEMGADRLLDRGKASVEQSHAGKR
jgi:hypothetical protein